MKLICTSQALVRDEGERQIVKLGETIDVRSSIARKCLASNRFKPAPADPPKAAPKKTNKSSGE